MAHLKQITKKDKYAFVHWIAQDGAKTPEKKSFSVYKKASVPNQKQLYNPDLIDFIPHEGTGPAPKEGWKKYPAVVLALGGECSYIYRFYTS